MLVLAIELAKYYFTLDEIAEVLSDELGALLARPDTVRYLRKQKA
jgi:hypothetical protein